MSISKYYTPAELESSAKALFAEERKIIRLDGWFLLREASSAYEESHSGEPSVIRTAKALQEAVKVLPLSISTHAVFAGTQRDAFARSYALINPNFKVSTFNGYCDPTAVYDDIEPCEEIPSGRIETLRETARKSPFVRELSKVYEEAKTDTEEVAFFVEQVTGHLIPDFRTALKNGVSALLQEARERGAAETSAVKKQQYEAMAVSLETVLVLSRRYAQIAEAQLLTSSEPRKSNLQRMITALHDAPVYGAKNLYESLQLFIILWQVMCLEQAPNPFAFSVGNADRIFEPYRAIEDLSREEASGLFKHFLVFFNVGDRSWAISQNILIGGKNQYGTDLTSLSSYALLDAYFAMNLPQPILSVKLHHNTPDALYEEMGRFFFTPGCLTPSLFNDDALFGVLEKHGVAPQDLEDYSIAGCQEPLIMGKDNGNTTNSWLNLPKILELTLQNGYSEISGKKIGAGTDAPDALTLLSNIRSYFYRAVDDYTDRMCEAANGASKALSHLPVPFLSCFMGGLKSGIDTRSRSAQGTVYNGSGCLIHGLSVIADSFCAIDSYLKEYPGQSERLLTALKNNFEGDDEIRRFLRSAPKFGNHIKSVDLETAEVASRISDRIASLKNYLGNPFRPDWSTPSTHLLYGYWVGATPDGRKAREMLNYGIDPLYGEAQNGLGFRVLSTLRLPFEKFNGGYASHIGLDPKYFTEESLAKKGLSFKTRIMEPLFFLSSSGKTAPFYLYLNVTTPETLRKVLANPKKYAPSGVYIMRIHGTFVNFLDLSPEIQQDIICRLDLKSTVC